jgi:hypothetical protein
MFARIMFGSSNIPKMTDLELFQSRCYEILGNTCEYRLLYGSFNLPYPSRVFRFLELTDFNNRQFILSRLTTHEVRGVFMNINLTATNCDNV